MTFEEVYEQVKDVEGWMGPSDCHALYDRVVNLKGLIVEIGAFAGKSTMVLALSSPNSKVVTIDPYLSPNGPIKDEFLLNTRGMGVELINKPSQEAGKTWKKKIDFLLIDGDHHYDFVKKDIELFVPHVKNGGYVFFHDYTADQESNGWGVKQAADELGDIEVVSGFGVWRVG